MLLLVICYHRFYWWPIHPIGYLTAYSFSMKELWFCFFLGWLFKAYTIRFFGSKGYHDMKPIAMGFIAGELLGGVIPMIIGAIYFIITGERPPEFKIF